MPPPAWSAGKVALKKVIVLSRTPRRCALLDQAVHSCMRNLTEQGQSIEDLGTLGSPHFQLQQVPIGRVRAREARVGGGRGSHQTTRQYP